MQDLVERIDEKIVDVYKAKQMDTFRYLESIPQQWEMCKIIDINEHDRVGFDLPKDFKVVTPTSDRFGNNNELICELCGHIIKHPYPIRNNNKKFLMFVGSVCIDTFTEAGYVTKQIIRFKENKARENLNNWLDFALRYIDTKKDSNGWLSRNLWDFKSKLLKIKENGIDTVSTRKINNIFTKAKELKIPTENLENENKIIEEKVNAELNEFRDFLRNLHSKGFWAEKSGNWLKLIRLSNNEIIECANNQSELNIIKDFGFFYSNYFECFVKKVN